MQCYFGQGDGDLAYQKDVDYFDRLPSPDSWSQWGNSGWPNNFDAGKISDQSDEKSQQQMLFGKDIDEVERSYGSSNFEGFSGDSFARNSAACACPDYCFNNLTGFDPMDDIFLNSFLQEDAAAEALSALSPRDQHNILSSESDSTRRMFDFRSNSCDTGEERSFNCFRTPTFAPVDGVDNGHVRLSNENNSDQSSRPSIKTVDMISFDQEASRRSEDEDSQIEESVLMGLETVLGQLSDSTRLCFRNSFYRLVQHSKQQMSMDSQIEGLALDNFSVLEAGDELSRSGRTEKSEMETNTIDRAVANLIFSKVNTNVQDILPAMATKFECTGKDFSSTGLVDYGLNQEDMYLYSKPSTDLLVKSKFPISVLQEFLPMQIT